jgi:hypothetical protein
MGKQHLILIAAIFTGILSLQLCRAALASAASTRDSGVGTWNFDRSAVISQLNWHRLVKPPAVAVH